MKTKKACFVDKVTGDCDYECTHTALEEAIGRILPEAGSRGTEAFQAMVVWVWPSEPGRCRYRIEARFSECPT
jgi:hypothetical protein